MDSQRILHVSSELAPYFPDKTQANSVLNLAKAMYKKGHDVRIFMPKFGAINERRFQLHEVIRLSGMNLIINDLDQPLVIKVASLPGERMQVYFIDNDEYFKRKLLYSDEKNKWFEDNGERAVFFVKGVVETIKKLNWVPDVIHVHGWMAAILPIYLKSYYSDDSFFKNSRIIFSVYNADLDQTLENTFHDILAFDNVEWKNDTLIRNIIKEAMILSQIIVKGEEQLDTDLDSFINTLDKEILEFNSLETIINEYATLIEEGATVEN